MRSLQGTLKAWQPKAARTACALPRAAAAPQDLQEGLCAGGEVLEVIWIT